MPVVTKHCEHIQQAYIPRITRFSKKKKLKKVQHISFVITILTQQMMSSYQTCAMSLTRKSYLGLNIHILELHFCTTDSPTTTQRNMMISLICLFVCYNLHVHRCV